MHVKRGAGGVCGGWRPFVRCQPDIGAACAGMRARPNHRLGATELPALAPAIRSWRAVVKQMVWHVIVPSFPCYRPTERCLLHCNPRAMGFDCGIRTASRHAPFTAAYGRSRLASSGFVPRCARLAAESPPLLAMALDRCSRAVVIAKRQGCTQLPHLNPA